MTTAPPPFPDIPEGLSDEEMLAWINAHPPPPPSAEILAKRASATEAALLTLDPNRFSDIKRVKSAFSLPSVLVRLGEVKKFEVHGVALPTFRSFMLRCNAPAQGFFYITNLLTANVLSTVGVPAKDWPAEGWTENIEEAIQKGEPTIVDGKIHSSERHVDRGCWLDAYGDHPFELPTLSKVTRVTLEGVYTGDVPTGYKEFRDFMFTMTFFGNASLV
jgi:hypothetical protein